MTTPSTPTTELSPFQIEKLKYFLKFLEPNETPITDKSRWINTSMQRVHNFTGWTLDHPLARRCLEVYTGLIQAFSDYVAEVHNGNNAAISLDDWTANWSRILSGCKGMGALPLWLQLMPGVLFGIIDRNDDKIIQEEELTVFYKDLIPNIPQDLDVEKLSQTAYNAMTDSGRHQLTPDSFQQIFANFLFGQTPHGPGKFLFGCFQHDTAPFQLIQPVAPEDEEDGQSVPLDGSRAPQVVKRPRKFCIQFT